MEIDPKDTFAIALDKILSVKDITQEEYNIIYFFREYFDVALVPSIKILKILALSFSNLKNHETQEETLLEDSLFSDYLKSFCSKLQSLKNEIITKSSQIRNLPIPVIVDPNDPNLSKKLQNSLEDDIYQYVRGCGIQKEMANEINKKNIESRNRKTSLELCGITNIGHLMETLASESAKEINSLHEIVFPQLETVGERARGIKNEKRKR